MTCGGAPRHGGLGKAQETRQARRPSSITGFCFGSYLKAAILAPNPLLSTAKPGDTRTRGAILNQHTDRSVRIAGVDPRHAGRQIDHQTLTVQHVRTLADYDVVEQRY